MPRTIVLSYGLRRRLPATLDRARRYGHPIELVAATPSARRGLRNHRSRLVTVHDGAGRDALLAALEGADDDVVLLLHEDVLLDPAAAGRLLEVASLPDQPVAVPATNHRDVDGAVGALDPDVVQPLGPRTTPVPVERLRSACIAATGWRLRQLVRQRLTAATTRLYLPTGVALLVREAVATHLDEGRDQVEPPVGPDGRPLLVASMIVRDEEQFLGDCLASLEGLVDRIDVCDTGSTDRTIEIARAAGATVIEREWRDDFAWARNEALAMSRDAWWVLHVDADERVRVADPVALRSFLATAIADGEAFDVPLHDLTADGTDVGGMQLPRLFRADDTTFVGAVHEVPRWRSGASLLWTVCEELRIEHLGYQAHVIQDRDKQARNLRIARADHDARGTSGTALQLARSLGIHGSRRDELIGILEPLHTDIEAGTDGLNESGRIPVYDLYARALMAEGRTDEAWAVIDGGRERIPHSSLLRARHAEIAVATGRFGDVVAAEQAAAELRDGARPWNMPTADAARLLELAKSQLATDDVAGAGATTLELLASPVLGAIDRWLEIVSLVALSQPDRAVELLLDAVVADQRGKALYAVAATFDQADAAAFAVEVARRVVLPTDDQRAALEEVVVAHGDVALVGELLDALGDGADARLWDSIDGAPAEVVTWLAGRLGHELEAIDLDEALAALTREGSDVDGRLATHLAADRSTAALERLAREVAPDIAAPVAAAAVAEGARADRALRIALALVTVAGDAEAARVLAPHLDALDTETIDTTLSRAAGRGATDVTTVLAQTLLRRTAAGVGAGQGTS